MMTFGDAILTGIRKYFVFTGRATRSEFWWFSLFVLLLDRALAIFGSIYLASVNSITLILGVVWLIIMFPIISASSRRLHDTGHSGWMQILPIVFAIILYTGLKLETEISNVTALNLLKAIGVLGSGTFFVFLITWLASAGENGVNNYGDDPNAENIIGVFD